MPSPCLLPPPPPGNQAQPAPRAAPDPPRPYPVSYYNIYGRIKCYADAVIRPTSTDQLASAVKQLRAASSAAGRALKIRVSRSVFHGTPSFGCPGDFGPGYGSPVPFTQPYTQAPFASAAAPSTAAVLIDALDQVTGVDRLGLRVTVQVGRRIDRFLKWAEDNGFSMERGAPSTYAELSISGVIATGGHGVGHNVTCNMVRRSGPCGAAALGRSGPRDAAALRAQGWIGFAGSTRWRGAATQRTTAQRLSNSRLAPLAVVVYPFPVAPHPTPPHPTPPQHPGRCHGELQVG
jgi:hypothetical protein